jgi:hypothetical protein
VVDPGWGGSFGREARKAKSYGDVWGVAVVKVTPPIGSVKYKAQHIVLPVRIPVLTGRKWPGPAKNKGFCCGFSPKAAKLTGLLLSNRASFEGRRDGAGEQGAEVVQMVWIEVGLGGNVGNWWIKRGKSVALQ